MIHFYRPITYSIPSSLQQLYFSAYSYGPHPPEDGVSINDEDSVAI